jgi:hypothetical protein
MLYSSSGIGSPGNGLRNAIEHYNGRRIALCTIALDSTSMQSADERFSEESRKFLLEVKKGKARKFVLTKDGVQIDRLIIFKAGTFDRVVREARQDGAWGDMYFGMLQGDGTDIRFELSRADGFTNPPGTEVRLKEFLREVTGLKFEPAYVIVDNLVTVEQAEDDGADDDSESSQMTESAVADSGSSVVEVSTEDKFVRILKSILPHVKRALAAKTLVSAELQQSVREAQELGRRRDFDPGLAALRRVGELTKQALAETESTMPAADASDSATQSRVAQPTRRQQWDDRLAAVQSRFDKAVAGSTTNVDKLQKVMGYAQNEARQQRFVKALVGLDRLERLLNNSE